MPPAPLPVLAGVYYCRIEGTSDAKQVTNIVAYQKAGVALGSPADLANATAVGQAVAANWGGVAGQLHTAYTGVETACYPLGSPLIPAVVTPMVAPGGRIGTEHFLQLAGRIKHTVVRRGRGSQHSSYLSPMSNDDITVNGDQVTTSWQANTQAAWAAFLAAMLTQLGSASPGAWTLVQVSKFQNKAYTPAFYPIINSETQVLLSSQRRRLGRG